MKDKIEEKNYETKRDIPEPNWIKVKRLRPRIII
jgi:hypothetical protein